MLQGYVRKVNEYIVLCVQAWDLEQGRCVRTLTGHSRPVQRLHISAGRLYSIGGRSLRVWDLQTYACLRIIQQPRENGALYALAVDPNDTLYVAGQVGPTPFHNSFGLVSEA